MYESPDTLEEICLNVVCDNIFSYIELDTQTDEDIEENDCSVDKYQYIPYKRYKFRSPDIYLINQISEKLLNKMMKKRLLCDATLNLFNQHNTKLKCVIIKNCDVSKRGLKILKQHKITDLEIMPVMHDDIGDVIDCLSDWSMANLRSANFAHCSYGSEMFRRSFQPRYRKLGKLQQLRVLNIAFSKIDQVVFMNICKNLKALEKLNISGTCITDLKPLEKLSTTLTSLSLCDMCHTNEFNEQLISVLTKLPNLKFLDLSLFQQRIDKNMSYFPTIELLDKNDILPELEWLDVSGWKEFVLKESLLRFIDTHPKLIFLGLVLCSVTFAKIFCKPKPTERLRNVRIAGLGTEEQIKIALQYYSDRDNYVQKILYYLFQLTSSFPGPRPDVFNYILPAMETHSTRCEVQIAATACLYNLTKGDLSKHIHPQTLSKGVELTLAAMASFPTQPQLQKNSLLTLCSDRILQEVTFNRFKCAKLVLDALCIFDEVNMNRMAVAICSILASKVSTEETSELGANLGYMQKLLSMVQSRVDTQVSDITLKFTLSALWNLTDESAATCSVFLEQGGNNLYLQVLKTFKGNAQIETKVLGLLNNIAEVARLRGRLLTNRLLNTLHELLKSENIDVSYFAAGIVAHLTSDGNQAWKSLEEGSLSRREMLDTLAEAVAQWEVPESEMVAYRSFKPFFPLLRVDMAYQVQLWAVWAINHVCTKNPSRYCQMLYDERGHVLLKDLTNFGTAHSNIRCFSQVILSTLKEKGFPV
ncbi:hypothetical protein ABEB36_007865 [Hypothenemus hampei]|uniref:Protein zer-1 homolog-like C-terminal domain-containing protein n=1 Tax=Hypothenemus hampei TaxID=57062 RepID=A0ABD1EXV7_HYPHA